MFSLFVPCRPFPHPHHTTPHHTTPHLQVRLDTAKLARDMVSSSARSAALKVKDSVLPAAAKLSSDADGAVREEAQAVLVAFAVQAGSMSILDKVRGGGLGREHVHP